jgi:hypothetical protein
MKVVLTEDELLEAIRMYLKDRFAYRVEIEVETLLSEVEVEVIEVYEEVDSEETHDDDQEFLDSWKEMLDKLDKILPPKPVEQTPPRLSSPGVQAYGLPLQWTSTGMTTSDSIEYIMTNEDGEE